MNKFLSNNFETEIHSQELDFIYEQTPESIEETVFEDNGFIHTIKPYFRLLRKRLQLTPQKEKNFTSIIYLTLDCPPYTQDSLKTDSPLEYANKLRLQYPENLIKILIPIIKDKPDNKPLLSFKFFIQNRITSAYIYKLAKNPYNIEVYGIYSPSFSNCKNIAALSRIHYLAPFLRAARLAVNKLKCDIVHCENIPYFLGCEFNEKTNSNTKVLQIIKDFTRIEMSKPEIFWSAINLADKKAMKKICRDKIIKKEIANLFKLHNTRNFHQIKDCLIFIYKNYYKFRKYIDKGADIDENIIFKHLNKRITQIFPQFVSGAEEIYFNPMIYTLKKADWISTISETYYNEILANPKLSGEIYNKLKKIQNKFSYLNYGCDKSKFLDKKIYHYYNLENFREERKYNKTALLKKLGENRIRTNFVDTDLFKAEEDIKIAGYLDAFYDSPLLFANPDNDIFAYGIDILFNTILKLFEMHKNIQVIICIKDGLKSKFIKSWIDFLSKNKYFNGRWIFIDGTINPEKFLASSDMILIPQRTNIMSSEHFSAMYYGCVPVAARCGILNDTIKDIFDDIVNGCGFKTKTSLLCEDDNNEIFLNALIKALNLYQNNPSSWNLLIKNCMNQNTDWNFEILQEYQEVYNKLK